MGDRASVIITSKDFKAPITIYGHWGGTTNAMAVAKVLERTDRVGDANYLTAQVFYEYAVSLNEYDGNLSFGIGAYDDSNGYGHGATDDNPPIILNADTGEVEYQGKTYTGLAFVMEFMPHS
jgi:2-methylaconitate cis-trans-isomerase PrpF